MLLRFPHSVEGSVEGLQPLAALAALQPWLARAPMDVGAEDLGPPRRRGLARAAAGLGQPWERGLVRGAALEMGAALSR